MGKRPYTVLLEIVEGKEKPSTMKGVPTASNRLRPHFQEHFFLIQEKKWFRIKKKKKRQRTWEKGKTSNLSAERPPASSNAWLRKAVNQKCLNEPRGLLFHKRTSSLLQPLRNLSKLLHPAARSFITWVMCEERLSTPTRSSCAGCPLVTGLAAETDLQR